VVDVDGRHPKRAISPHLQQAMDPCCRFFTDAVNYIQLLGMPLMQQLSEITSIIEHHVRRPAIDTFYGLLDAPPEFVLAFPFPGEYGDICSGNGCSSMV